MDAKGPQSAWGRSKSAIGSKALASSKSSVSLHTAGSLRRPGGSLTESGVPRHSGTSAFSDPRHSGTSAFSDPWDSEALSEDDALECTGLCALCKSICRRCGRRAGKVRRAAVSAVQEEAHQAWGKTKTAQRLGAIRRKFGCLGRRPSRDCLRNWRKSLGSVAKVRPGRGGRKKRKSEEEVMAKLKKGAGGDVGFGVNCFIIHNPGNLENYFEVKGKELNVGGSAKVYKAIERSTRIERAVKKIWKVDPTEVRRAVQEVAIMKVLDHPNIVKLFETFQDDKHLYLVMELCDGGDLLDKLIGMGAYNEYQAAVIIRTVLMTLNYMHANGYTHRDIKPENVMFKEARKDVVTSALRLVDFGFSCKLPGNKAQMTEKVGSPLYVAPEVIEGEYDERCDIWSVGVLTYVLLCGYPPFLGSSDAETLHLIRQGEYVFRRKHWQSISKPAKHIIRHMIEPDRNSRLPMKEALGHPWLKARGVLRVQRMRDETVDRLLTFNTYHKLRRAAMLAVAYQLEADEVRELVELFQGLDLNGDGLLTSPEFVKGVQACGIEESWITRMMSSVDADNSGVIDFCEFLAATLDQKMYIKNHAALFRAFRSFDQDDSGALSREEIAETLHMTGPEDLEEVKDFFKDVDLNGDGVMDYGEFYSLLQREVDPEKTVFKVEDEFNLKRRSSLRSSRSSRSSFSVQDVAEAARRSGRSTARSSGRSSARSSNEDGATTTERDGDENAEEEDDGPVKPQSAGADSGDASKDGDSEHEDEERAASSGSERSRSSRGSSGASGSGSRSRSLSSVSMDSDDSSRSRSDSRSGSRQESSEASCSRPATASSRDSRQRRIVSVKSSESSGEHTGRLGRTLSRISSNHSEVDEGPATPATCMKPSVSADSSPASSPKGEERARSKRSVQIKIDSDD